MPDAETALLLYDRYFSGSEPRPVSDLAGFPCAKQGLRAVMTDRGALHTSQLPAVVDRAQSLTIISE